MKGGWGEEDKMKTERKKKEKRVGIKYLKTKGSTVLILYIGILVTSTTTGHDGSMVVHLLHKQKVGVQFPVDAQLFLPQVFSFFPFLRK